MSHHVAILAYDRLCTFEFGCAVELFVLERPELGVDWYSYAVCAIEPGPLRAAGGLTLQAPHGLDALDGAGTIVIPGWRDADEAPPPALLDALRRAHARGARLCSICSGAFVLAHAGLLFGAEIANRVAQRLVIPAHRDGDQAQRVARPLPRAGTDPIAHTMDWIRENLRAAHTLSSMAGQARMGVRTFQRHFKDRTGASPLDWLVRERVMLATRLLETRPALGIDAVADLAGLGSPESLRRHFRSHGLPPPARYRRQHRK
jgi:AraC family transcriptional activator FtrA